MLHICCIQYQNAAYWSIRKKGQFHVTNQSRKGAYLKKIFQPNAAYLLHNVVKILSESFGFYNWLYQSKNLRIRALLNNKSIQKGHLFQEIFGSIFLHASFKKFSKCCIYLQLSCKSACGKVLNKFASYCRIDAAQPAQLHNITFYNCINSCSK